MQTLARRIAIGGALSGVMFSGLVATSAAASPDFDPIPRSEHEAGPLIDDIPDDAPLVQPFEVGTPVTTTISADDSGVVTGLVTDESDDPVVGALVTVVATSEDGEVYQDSDTTNADGEYRVELSLPSGTYTVVATAGNAESGQAVISRQGSLNVKVRVATTVSERATDVTVQVRDNGVLARGKVVLFGQEPTQSSRSKVGSATAVGGVATFRVRPWKNPVYTAVVTRKGLESSASETARTTPRFKLAKRPAGSPQPANVYPVGEQPIGGGAKSISRKIPGNVWRSMNGLTWRKGCTPRKKLRLVQVNYRGFDGYRHRGQIVVSRSIGKKTAKIFKRLYKKRFPIRQMQLVDVYGKNRGGRPGANDYKSMAADNTSAFNCRYVVGRESQRVRSPHASGRSLDINPFENPYVSAKGTYPNTYYLNRSAKSAGMFKSRSKATKVLRKVGCHWGGGYRDYHHFDC